MSHMNESCLTGVVCGGVDYTLRGVVTSHIHPMNES